MLQDGSDTSNTDPFASQLAAGQQWINSPPHVMFIPGPGQILELADRNQGNSNGKESEVASDSGDHNGGHSSVVDEG
jgi:hypothetical protein